ncbi:MAG: hypothetical protein KGI69_03005 [Patescibacteria group bacterium]|nr:hypothetical protein [Patescibacteria group bacterium]
MDQARMKAILDRLPEQLAYRAEVANKGALPEARSIVVGGMGGSHLSASLIKDIERMPGMAIRSDYGLPELAPEAAKDALYIAVSHSGNTEETLDFADQALKRRLPLAVVSTGGALLRLARDRGLPHVAIPLDDAIPPRLATGYMATALYALMGMESSLARLGAIARSLAEEGDALEAEAAALVDAIGEAVPLVYSSASDYSLAYYLKIAMNETAKRPAFCGAFPEMDHNELAGFTLDGSSAPYCMVTIRDPEDHPRISRRMDLTESIVAGKGARTARIALSGADRPERFWRAVMVIARASFGSAQRRGVDPVETALIESFKKSLS